MSGKRRPPDTYTRKGKSAQYKYVYEIFNHQKQKTYWLATVSKCMLGKSFSSYYSTEREAAKAVDMELIKAGKNPVNIFKKAA